MSETNVKIAYLCDKKECEVCNNPECMHTCNIEHASSFYKVDDDRYMEHFRPSITLERFVKCFVSEDEWVKVFCFDIECSGIYNYDGFAGEILRDKIDIDLANRKVISVAVTIDGSLHITVE